MQSSILGNFINILVAPGEAYASIRQRPAIVYPLLTISAAFAAVMVFYYLRVDFEWMVDNMAAATPPETSEETREAMREGMRSMGPTFFTVIAAVQGAFTYLLIWILGAAYLSVVSAIKNDGIKFPEWLAFEAWSAVPVLLLCIAIVANILVHPNGQIGVYEFNPLSLNTLFFNLEPSQKGATFLSSLHLVTFWCAGLKIFGYRQWTGRSLSGSGLIILIPYFVWFGGLAFMAFR